MIRRLLSVSLLVGLVGTASAGEVRFTGEGHAYNPVWSLDGKHLAFEVNNYGDRSDLHISVVNGEIAKDASKVNLPGGGGPFGGSQVVVNPAWHPQGIVVFEGSNTGGQFRLYYYQPGGGAASEMISTTDVPGDITFPAINHKGTSMIFVADQTGNGDLYTRDTNTGKVSVAMQTDVAEMFPQFDAGGSKILFTRKQNNTEDIFELALATGAESPVTGGNNDQTRPNYAAGGVVYFDNSRDSQSWDVKYVSGGNAKVLAKSVRLPLRARPAISPDGNWVAYGFEDPTKSDSIMISKVDGSKNVEIKTPYNACGEPAITVQNGKTLLAYTALPSSGADYRRLFVVDITGKL
ncbi:MAG: PD40 domain-containing protein [Alphaproteobacteria bacterium]|nr:PD40 domain-containing protein [Alphaproteobacteria bacterium]